MKRTSIRIKKFSGLDLHFDCRSIFFRAALSLSVLALTLSACIAKKDIILPTRYERQMLQDQYRQCITRSTNKIYDNTTPPEEIVRASFGNCRGARQAMLQAYPRRWHEHMADQIDQEIYQSELAWIENKRN